MSRKPLAANQSAGKEVTFNSLVKQLEDTDSLINFLPPDVKQCALTVPEEFLNLDEEALLKSLAKGYKFRPTPTTEAIRHNFWMEFDRVVTGKKDSLMNMTNVYFGVCSRAHYHNIVNDPYAFSYVLTRPPEYEAIQAGMLSLATRRLREILSIPLKKKDGELQDAKIIEIILKASAMVDLRNKGGYINRSETKNMTLIEQNTKHTYAGMFSAASNDGTKTAAAIQSDIDEKLKALEDETRNTSPLPQPRFTIDDTIVTAEYKEVVKDDGKSSA